MSVINVDLDVFKNTVVKSEKIVLLDFWAPWCPPCRIQSPVVDEIAAERPDIMVGKVNTDEQSQLATMFAIENIPTLIIFKDGNAVRTIVGFHEKSQILEIIDSL